MRSAVLAITCAFLAFARAAVPAERPQPEAVRLPPGFSIGLYASVPGARSLAVSPSGTVFVGTRGEGKVYALTGSRDPGRAGEVVTVAEGLDMPNGVAFRDGALYVAEVRRILRFDGIESRLKDPGRPVVVDDSFPGERSHGWKFIGFGPDGRLYVPVGAPCNACEPASPVYAAIHRMRPDGSSLERFAGGVRNTVGFDWNPADNVLWFTDNGRDRLGDDVPPDELNRAPAPGLDFGFPYVYGKNVPDPKFGKKGKGRNFTPPERNLGAHVASLGMRFYAGKMFPERYRGSIFIAEHGSWDRTVPSGYRVTFVRLEDGRPAGYEVFAQGWLRDGKAWGRPVDVQVMPDGALLVSDDGAGAVYRITYGKE